MNRKSRVDLRTFPWKGFLRTGLAGGVLAVALISMRGPLSAEKIRRRACVRYCLPECCSPGRYRQVYPSLTGGLPASVSKSLVSNRLQVPAGGSPVVVGFSARTLAVDHVSLENVAAIWKSDGTVLLTGRLRNAGDADKHILRNRVTVHLRGYASSPNAANGPDGPVILETRQTWWLERDTSRPLRLFCKSWRPQQLTALANTLTVTHLEVELEMRVPPDTASRTRSNLERTPKTP